MHRFTDLVDRSTAFSLAVLREASERTSDALQTSAATSLVKTLQMIQLQKAILAVGMFSLFEAMLQDGLNCKDGFREANNILAREGQAALQERFNDLQSAINVLKHRHGRSYDILVAKAGALPFRVKLPGESLFYEGDVSEISTLIEVDDRFVLSCAEMIQEVSETIRKARPEFLL
ncbi:MAG TPA: hypothetical protein VKK31_14045 [Thermoanaerobaculia bacterium]|nr:hypothetical protein [Thermoanaerobaculia bacterium]